MREVWKSRGTNACNRTSARPQRRVPLEVGCPHGRSVGTRPPARCPPTHALQVLGIPACLSDPKLSKFDVDQCPGLLRMLDALNLGNTNPAVSCEDSCVQQFAKVWRGGAGRGNPL